jgi:drug/metabolite transporter (DMT)-like permease
VAVLLALGAALLYAAASVLQQREAERQPPHRELRPSLLARLAVKPRWLAGLSFDIAGYVAQWLALSRGSLVVVQPLLVVGLLFALPMKARLSPYRMQRWDWTGAVLTTLGLAVFLTVSDASVGHANVRATTWWVLLGAVAVVSAVLVTVGVGSSPRWKAMAYGTAAGVIYGACAALTKTCSYLLASGVSTLFENWQPYVLAAGGIAGMVLAQSAFQVGPLDASLPTLSATDPVVSVVVGAIAFGEVVRTGLFATSFEVMGLAAMVAGIFMLAHTEAVNAVQARPLARAQEVS